MPLGMFPILVLMLLVMLPLLFLDVMTMALGKLGISPLWAPWIVFFMFVGSLINIPVSRKTSDEPMSHHPLNIWGAHRFWPDLEKQLTERIIAVNVGGFVIPMLLVLYEIYRLIHIAPEVINALMLCVAVNIIACYWTARPVPKVGVVMPAFLPGAMAALSALTLAPDMAPPVAFCAGVLGPVIGADFMNLKNIRQAHIGIASIGGAGTFDGIVLSGLLAVVLT